MGTPFQTKIESLIIIKCKDYAMIIIGIFIPSNYVKSCMTQEMPGTYVCLYSYQSKYEIKIYHKFIIWIMIRIATLPTVKISVCTVCSSFFS